MRIFTVDEAKCVRCGACAEVCPLGIIRFKEGRVPLPYPMAKKACISCGHCVSVCPEGALSHEAVPAGGCVPVKEELVISEEQMKQYFRSRRSIRTYQNKPVDKTVLEDLIGIAGYAPTGHNRQNVN